MLLFLKNLVFTLVVPGTVAGYVPWLIVRGQPIGSRGCLLASLALFTVGGTIYLWCVWDFASFGRGTPAPIDAPKKLVVRGLYRAESSAPNTKHTARASDVGFQSSPLNCPAEGVRVVPNQHMPRTARDAWL